MTWKGGQMLFQNALNSFIYLVTVAASNIKSARFKLFTVMSYALALCRLQRNFQLQKSAKIRQSDFRKHSFKTLYTSRTCSKFGRDNKLRAQSLVVKPKSHL